MIFTIIGAACVILGIYLVIRSVINIDSIPLFSGLHGISIGLFLILDMIFLLGMAGVFLAVLIVIEISPHW